MITFFYPENVFLDFGSQQLGTLGNFGSSLLTFSLKNEVRKKDGKKEGKRREKVAKGRKVFNRLQKPCGRRVASLSYMLMCKQM